MQNDLLTFVSAIHDSLESNRVNTEMQHSFNGSELSEFQHVSAESIEAIIPYDPRRPTLAAWTPYQLGF